MRNKKEFTPEEKLKRAECAREWRKKNPEKAKEHAKKSRIKNRTKILARQKIWTENNKERHSEQAKIWYGENKERTRGNQLKLHYGISFNEYEELLKKQNNECAICGGPSGKRSFSVDHDHINGKVRGLLCRGCNVGIGNLNDDPELLEKAIIYIKKFREDL
jgi:hypothetical protein